MTLVARPTTKGTVYWIVFRWQGKQVWERSGTDKRAAERLDQRRKKEIKAGTYQPETARQATTFGQWARQWIEQRRTRTAHDDRQRLEQYVLTRAWLEEMPLCDLAPKHLLRLVTELKQDCRHGKPLAAKTVANIYGVVTVLVRDARIQELIHRDPCVLPRGTVRRGVTKRRVPYEASEVLRLIGVHDDRGQKDNLAQDSAGCRVDAGRIAGLQLLHAERHDRTARATDNGRKRGQAAGDGGCASTVRERVAPEARVWNAIAFLTGMREGEVCGLIWRDWDRSTRPLGCLVVERQYDGQPLKTSNSGDERPRRVPVHPLLETILSWWWAEGYEFVHCRKPRLDDPIVPRRAERYRGGRRKAGPHHTQQTGYHQWRAACVAAGVANRSLHSTRHTFVSLARRGGARKDVLERITHNSSGDIVDAYTTWDWAPLCEAVMCLGLGETVDEGAIRKDAFEILDTGRSGGRTNSVLAVVGAAQQGVRELQRRTMAPPGAQTGSCDVQRDRSGTGILCVPHLRQPAVLQSCAPILGNQLGQPEGRCSEGSYASTEGAANRRAQPQREADERVRGADPYPPGRRGAEEGSSGGVRGLLRDDQTDRTGPVLDRGRVAAVRSKVDLAPQVREIIVGEAGFEPVYGEHDPLYLLGLIRGESWL